MSIRSGDIKPAETSGLTMPDVFTEDTEDEHVVNHETIDDEINWVPDVFIEVNKDEEVEGDIVNPAPKFEESAVTGSLAPDQKMFPDQK